MAKHRSILEELNQISIDRSKNYVVENRAEHLIHGAINLLEQIDDNYSPEDAKNLGNRLINSIKHRDPSKFSRGIKKIIKENRKGQTLKISEVIDKTIVEAPFDDFNFDLQDKLMMPDGRPKAIAVGKSGLKAVYHKQSNSFKYLNGPNAGDAISGLMLRRIWNNLGVGIGGTEKGIEKRDKENWYSQAKSWFAGGGDSDTARSTRLDPTASKMKKGAVGAYMAMFGPKGPPARIPLSDETKELLDLYVDKGYANMMMQSFNDAVKIGQEVGVKGKIEIAPGATNIERNKKALAAVTAEYNKLIAKWPDMKKLLIHLAQTGEFVPAMKYTLQRNSEKIDKEKLQRDPRKIDTRTGPKRGTLYNPRMDKSRAGDRQNRPPKRPKGEKRIPKGQPGAGQYDKGNKTGTWQYTQPVDNPPE